MIIKLLPEEERPVEKAARLGISALSNAELLGLILYTGTRSQSSVHLAEEILSRCTNGIRDMGSMTMEDLLGIRGIGSAKASRILASVELGKRIATSPSGPRNLIDCADDVAEMFMERLRYQKKEFFYSVLLNTRGEVIFSDRVSEGELNSTTAHPREVFSQAIRRSASGIIFVHNHPSGDPAPSSHDIETTRRLMECGELLGIQVLDHIIIGDGQYTSLKGMALME